MFATFAHSSNLSSTFMKYIIILIFITKNFIHKTDDWWCCRLSIEIIFKKYKYILGKKTTEAVFMYATNKQWNSFKMSKQKSKSTKIKLKT